MNVMIGDITIEDVNVAVAAQIVANVCANVDLDAALTLVGDVDQTSDANQVCRIGRAGRGPELTITQN